MSYLEESIAHSEDKQQENATKVFSISSLKWFTYVCTNIPSYLSISSLHMKVYARAKCLSAVYAQCNDFSAGAREVYSLFNITRVNVQGLSLSAFLFHGWAQAAS